MLFRSGLLEVVGFGVVFELIFQLLVVGKIDDEALETLGAVDFLDQTGQGVAALPGEDASDGGVAVLSDEAVFLTGLGTRHIERVERRRAFPDGKARLELFRERDGHADRSDRDGSESASHH